MIRSMIAAAAVAAFSTTAFAAGIDANGDGMVTADEYTTAVQNESSFAMYDADGDGMLSADEYNTAVWERYDMDADGMWNEEEMKLYDNDMIRAGKVKR